MNFLILKFPFLFLLIILGGCQMVPYEEISWQTRYETFRKVWETGEDGGACTANKYRCVTYTAVSYHLYTIGDMKCRYALEVVNGMNYSLWPQEVAICRSNGGSRIDLIRDPPRIYWW